METEELERVIVAMQPNILEAARVDKTWSDEMHNGERKRGWRRNERKRKVDWNDG